MNKIFKNKSPALLVIDVQNDFCSDTGVLARSGRSVKPMQRAVGKIENFLKYWRGKDLPIIFTRLIYDLEKLPKTHTERMKLKKVPGLCAPGSRGSEFYALKPEKGEKVIEKNYYSGFYRTSLDAYLKKLKIDTLVIAGVTTHVCPFLTCADAYYRGYNMVALKDCIGTYEAQAFVMRYLREQFSAVVVGSGERTGELGR